MSREKVSMRKDGPERKPGVLDVWCTVFWPEPGYPELAWAAEVYEVGGKSFAQGRSPELV